MERPIPSETELAEAIYRAAGAAFRELFARRPDEHFYYCTLITTGGALRPIAAAWSVEAVARDRLGEGARERYADELRDIFGEQTHAPGSRDAGDEQELIWDYADSPYSMVGDQYFAPVTELFARRPAMDFDDEDDWAEEWDLRLGAMETAMARLDEDNLFDRGEGRQLTLVAVEVMPPDFTNGERIERLNPPAVVRWARRHGWSDE